MEHGVIRLGKWRIRQDQRDCGRAHEHDTGRGLALEEVTNGAERLGSCVGQRMVSGHGLARWRPDQRYTLFAPTGMNTRSSYRVGIRPTQLVDGAAQRTGVLAQLTVARGICSGTMLNWWSA